MALHYHGLPLTPASLLDLLAGKNVCISYATARTSNILWALRYAQSIMWDNGAFSIFTQGNGALNPFEFYSWVEPYLGHPHWAVVPDVIDGSIEQQRELTKTWPFPKDLGAPVWHLGLSMDYLFELIDAWPRVCLGSSGQYWDVGSETWERRMDEVFNQLARTRRHMPHLHGLRMLGQLGKRWPLASADSVNVSRNFKSSGQCPGCMATQIDQVNSPLSWSIQEDLFV